MTVSFKEKTCECGLDLTTARPVHVIPIETTEAGDLLEPLGECPKCHHSYILGYGPEDKVFGLRTVVPEEPDDNTGEPPATDPTATEAGPPEEAEATATEAGPTGEGAFTTEPDPTVCPSCGGAKSPGASVCRTCYDAGRSEAE